MFSPTIATKLRTFDIVFVPGLRPKPEDFVFEAALLRCIEFGLQRYCAEKTAFRKNLAEAFRIYSWTHDVYGEHRDIGLDEAGIEALLAQPVPSDRQRAVIDAPARWLIRAAHRVGDRIPVLGRAFASDRQRMMLSEARNYLRDRNGVGTKTRAGLTKLLFEAWSEERELIVVGHSLGSVIAYDTLWEMSHASNLHVAHFITIGSPLGTRFVRKFVKGAGEPAQREYPANIQRWTNIAARGELTALYPRLREFYGEMLETGLLKSFEEHTDVYNHFVGARGLNVHSEYGYLILREFAEALTR